jgi:hypothetical protein
LTHADWGCFDGVHTAWLTVEAETREQARAIVPPILRDRARVIALNRFALEEIDELLRRHGPGAVASTGEATKARSQGGRRDRPCPDMLPG